ncbi:MAG: sigma-70 family RNA polymerase sigma factor [Proteobacteria bacterium]|nr:sigma-70 family RNA polymerase sigma factor [Pseudomonadota bacterium]
MEHISRTCFEALQKGEEQACSITFRHYQKFARHVALRCGVDPVTADDVIQMAFLRLYAHSAKLDGPSSIAQWLAVSIRNLCLDEFRKTSRMQRKSDAFAVHRTLMPDEPESPSEEDLFEGRLYAAAIREIDKSPDGQTLRAFYLEGKSIKEIATENREATGTVTARLSRMRKKLRDLLLKKISAWEDGR